MMPSVDARAVGGGAALALAIGVPAVLGFRVLDAVANVGCESNWTFVFYVPVLVAWVLGGRLAARRGPEAPFTHGLLAALAAYAVLAVVGLAIAAVGDRDPECGGAAAYVFNAMVATSGGILGALIATRRPRSRAWPR
jgi:hypothetical protein